MSPFASKTMRQAGLTLIELLVALTLGLFLSLGLVIMMGDSSRTFKIQDDYARMQESAVSALRYLSDTLRHAGFYGFAGETLLLTEYVSIGAVGNDCSNVAVGNTFATDRPLFGFDSVAAPPVPCILAENFRNPSSVLVARLGSGVPLRDLDNDGRFDDDTGAEPGFATTLYVQSDANTGFIFRGSDFAALVADPVNRVKQFANGNQIPVFPYQMHVYYVRPCSRPTGAGGRCQATDDAGQPIPTLVRQELRGATMVEQPLAEGVERMELMYGVDTVPAGGDGVADRFVFDPGADWASVVSIRVTLLVRTPTRISGQDDSGKCYDLNGNGTCDPAGDPRDFVCAGAACQYKRAVFSQLIQVRNVAFRRGA
jgi:type IV pilus assembly protein PilW